MDWATIVPYIFGFMGLAIAGWVAKSISDLSQSVKDMQKSVSELNTQIAVVISEQVHLERRVTRLEDSQ